DASSSKPAMGCDLSAAASTASARRMTLTTSSDTKPSTPGKIGIDRCAPTQFQISNLASMSTTYHTPRSRLRVSAYERISSLLVALLVMTGMVVAALLVLFFARKLITAQV